MTTTVIIDPPPGPCPKCHGTGGTPLPDRSFLRCSYCSSTGTEPADRFHWDGDPVSSLSYDLFTHPYSPTPMISLRHLSARRGPRHVISWIGPQAQVARDTILGADSVQAKKNAIAYAYALGLLPLPR